MAKYLRYFPKPLLEDLIAGRWLPIVGAGFSKNALVPARKKMPLWPDLGAMLGGEIGDYSASTPLDAISAYEHEYGRSKLIERLSEALLLEHARPGAAHKAFCSIQFDVVCTTNFDFLLERQYDLIPRVCTPLVEETQLSIYHHAPGVALLKLHGDLRHPERLVATETDYDRFLDRFPVLATFLANLLITRSAVLIGYSLDDPDFRQIWEVVGERLGRSRRPAYAVMVDASLTDVSRFQRRGVKVINLPGSKDKYASILTDAFDELSQFWRDNVIAASEVKDERPLRELSLPTSSRTRLCFFAVPLSLQSFYRERVFPLVREYGFVPVTADDVVSPGDVIQAKIDALLQRSSLLIVDASTQQTLTELRFAARWLGRGKILVIADEHHGLPIDVGVVTLTRPDISQPDPESFVAAIRNWLGHAAAESDVELLGEPERLLRAKEYRAAVIAAITLLESKLREQLGDGVSMDGRPMAIKAMLDLAAQRQELEGVRVPAILDWLKVRNAAVHTSRQVSKTVADEIVSGVTKIVRNLPPR